MTRHRRPSIGRRLSLALIGVLLLGMVLPPGRIATKKAEAQGRVKTVLAFPATDESDQKNLEETAARLTSALALVGQGVPEIDLEVFSASSPSVRRGLADGSLRRADVEGPKDAATALVIGRAFRVDSVVLVGVQSLTITDEPRGAEVSVIGTEYPVAANIDADTATVVAQPKGTTFGVSGVARARGGAAGEKAALIRMACMNAAQKIASVLAGKSAEVYVQTGAAPQKKSNLWKWVAAGLVVFALAVVAARAGGDHGGQPANVLLPTRISTRATSGVIRLSWVPPATTTKTIFKYQVQRSVDGSTFQEIDNNQVGPTATSFSDWNVLAGHAYVYQMRVYYADGTITEWVPRETWQVIAV